MAFLSVGKNPSKKQRLYILEFTILGEKVYKIGKASGTSSVDRLMDIVRSYFTAYRITPEVKIVRDREVPDDKVFEYETCLHKFFANYTYQPSKSFSGSTELFEVCKDDVIQAYEAVIEGNVPDFVYVHPDDVIPF